MTARAASLYSLVSDLASELDDPVMQDANVIQWGCPIPAFGDVSTSKLATVGLNPSNNEFVDRNGVELSGINRRFQTLGSLRLSRWSDLRKSDICKVVDSYVSYFDRNPYDSWFAQLDFIISGCQSTFYGSRSDACHLDLIPYATECKWTSLTSKQKAILFEKSGSALVNCINSSDMSLLILNGQSVVDEFAARYEIGFTKTENPNWSLPRRTGKHVKGFAYVAEPTAIAGESLNRNIRILGFNHNLQSSFGVTGQVRASIRDWVTSEFKERAG